MALTALAFVSRDPAPQACGRRVCGGRGILSVHRGGRGHGRLRADRSRGPDLSQGQGGTLRGDLTGVLGAILAVLVAWLFDARPRVRRYALALASQDIGHPGAFSVIVSYNNRPRREAPRCKRHGLRSPQSAWKTALTIPSPWHTCIRILFLSRLGQASCGKGTYRYSPPADRTGSGVG